MRKDFEDLKKELAPSSPLHMLTDSEIRSTSLKKAVTSVVELAKRAGIKDDNVDISLAYRVIVQKPAQPKSLNLRKEKPTLNTEDLDGYDDYSLVDVL
jgi:hypothetical protein